MEYNFNLVDFNNPVPVNPDVLSERPFIKNSGSFEKDAKRFVPSEELEAAINAALAVGLPLLITGEPGTGKTQTAYYIAYKLGIKVLHFQVKSDSNANDLLYHFDAVRYFHDANLLRKNKVLKIFDKKNYIEKRPLWEAFISDTPCVLLIDEIDKSPRDFPNDLLHELDKMQFKISETQQTIDCSSENRPIVVITSNSERRLPSPFLRRCVYHNIIFDEKLVQQALEKRLDDYKNLDRNLLNLAVERFLQLRAKHQLTKLPSTNELFVWLKILSVTSNINEKILSDNLENLPHLGALIKNKEDFDKIKL